MSKEIIKFLKTRDVKSPSRNNQYDAGIDFYVPKFTKEFIEVLKNKNESIFKIESNCFGSIGSSTSCSNTLTLHGCSNSIISYNLSDENKTLFKFDEVEGKLYFILSPHSRVLIPSGIHSRMASTGRCLIAFNKSGVASKLGLTVGACIIDATYTGEIHINIINTSTSNVRIYEDMKLIQFIETPVITNPIEIEEDNTKEGYTSFYEGMIKDRESKGFGSSDKK